MDYFCFSTLIPISTIPFNTSVLIACSICIEYVPVSGSLTIPIDKVFDIIEQNKKGNQPEKLEDYAYSREQKIDFGQVVGQDNLDRFDG